MMPASKSHHGCPRPGEFPDAWSSHRGRTRSLCSPTTWAETGWVTWRAQPVVIAPRFTRRVTGLVNRQVQSSRECAFGAARRRTTECCACRKVSRLDPRRKHFRFRTAAPLRCFVLLGLRGFAFEPTPETAARQPLFVPHRLSRVVLAHEPGRCGPDAGESDRVGVTPTMASARRDGGERRVVAGRSDQVRVVG